MSAAAQATPLLEAHEVAKQFSIGSRLATGGKATLHAVDGVSLQVFPGESLGLVGESGCGNSTLARAILRLIPSTSGEVLFAGEHLESLPEPELRPYRRRMQVIFQDPFSSLNPRMTVGEGIA